MVKIVKTDSYFNIFPLLTERLKDSVGNLECKNLVFSEEKVSLMAERWICGSLEGSFNTEVYSFGSFLLKHKTFDNLLSREGSAMVIKKILSEVNLTCFRKSKTTMASALYDLLILLKSASVTPSDIYNATLKTDGILKDKLLDVYSVFSAYEKYLEENGLEDQSGQLNYLPEVLENYQGLEETNVYVIGYNGFTAQIKKVLSLLMKRAKSFTAILPSGENKFVFVNETSKVIKRLANDLLLEVSEEFVKTTRPMEADLLSKTLFSSEFLSEEKIQTDKIFYSTPVNEKEEFEKIASVIEKKVREENFRYKNFSVVLPDESKKDLLVKAFNLVGVKYFIDEKTSIMNHPLVTLILSYVEIFRKNFSREHYLSFVKNPLIIEDKKLSDAFENYIYKYDINYSDFKREFKKDDEETPKMEEVRRSVSKYLEGFSPYTLLEIIDVKNRLLVLGDKLKDKARKEYYSINEQVYDYVSRILSEMRTILGEGKVTFTEFRNLLLSGLSAVKLSIIPQYNDAVFVGGFKEVGLYQTDFVFIPSLTSKVPSFKEDVAILSDNDLNLLSNVKVIIEPKVQVANHRLREETAMGITSFNKGLFLSYSITGENGSQNLKSELLSGIVKKFTVSEFPETKGYMSKKQGFKNYAMEISSFVHGDRIDIEDATAFRKAVGGTLPDEIANFSNKEVKIRLEEKRNDFLKRVSPTTLESYYCCPYKTFVEKTLSVKERKEGKLDAPTFGTLVHDIFCEFMKNINSITDENFKEVFDQTVLLVTEKKIYSAYKGEGEKAISLNALIKEAEKFCRRNYEWNKKGKFLTDKDHLEVNFGNKNLPSDFKEITLLDGEVKLTGVIDRVDVYGNYARVIDYKTGKADESFKALFSGEKLQLYLYALALKDKELAGAYYMPISDEYQPEEDKSKSLVVGNTLDNEEILNANDEGFKERNISEYLPVHISRNKLTDLLTSEEMKAMVEYARLMGEQASNQMKEGVIVPSPLKDVCKYCEYYAVCGLREENVREIKSVTSKTVTGAILGEENG